MEDRKEKHQEIPEDRHLDTPAEANRDKHINFLEVEEDSSSRSSNSTVDDYASERRKEWEQGIADGKKAREEGE